MLSDGIQNYFMQLTFDTHQNVTQSWKTFYIFAFYAVSIELKFVLECSNFCTCC